jgi:hypothetical protein
MAEPMNIVDAGMQLQQLREKNEELNLTVTNQAQRLEELEKTMKHITQSLLDGEFPQGLVYEVKNRKLVLEKQE